MRYIGHVQVDDDVNGVDLLNQILLLDAVSPDAAIDNVQARARQYVADQDIITNGRLALSQIIISGQVYALGDQVAYDIRDDDDVNPDAVSDPSYRSFYIHL